VTPDIATLGKVIGGGFPLAAIVGREDIMRHFDKDAVGADNWLMQLGTLSGNPVAAAAGLKTLEILRRPGEYDRLRELGSALMTMVDEHLSKAGIAHQIVGDKTLFDIVFTDKKVRNYRDVMKADADTNTKFNNILRAKSVFKSPGKTYPSLALTKDDLELTDQAIKKASEIGN
jgi:glutamate-1-semialdehyde 2,1-aminomutase